MNIEWMAFILAIPFLYGIIIILREVITEFFSNKHIEELTWFILANLILEKEALKKVGELLKEINNKPVANNFDSKKNEIRGLIMFLFHKKAFNLRKEYYKTKNFNIFKILFPVKNSQLENYIQFEFWESKVEYKMFEDLSFFKEKIVTLKPERKAQLENLMKVNQMKVLFLKRSVS